MKVSEKMAAVEQRRGREGMEDPPLRRMRIVTLLQSILGVEVLLSLWFGGGGGIEGRQPEAKWLLGVFDGCRMGKVVFTISTVQVYFSWEAMFPG